MEQAADPETAIEVMRANAEDNTPENVLSPERFTPLPRDTPVLCDFHGFPICPDVEGDGHAGLPADPTVTLAEAAAGFIAAVDGVRELCSIGVARSVAGVRLDEARAVLEGAIRLAVSGR